MNITVNFRNLTIILHFFNVLIFNIINRNIIIIKKKFLTKIKYEISFAAQIKTTTR